ncbi:hypothetical protein AFLA_003594 [Aspergillus flavus NRRL3357]|nr:hypothetical protein AFLA_003594 [Aspergillus flavus NRRL3357]
MGPSTCADFVIVHRRRRDAFIYMRDYDKRGEQIRTIAARKDTIRRDAYPVAMPSNPLHFAVGRSRAELEVMEGSDISIR